MFSKKAATWLLTGWLIVWAGPGLLAQDGPLPFSFFSVDGRVWAPGDTNRVHRLSFDTDFRLHPMSNGIQQGDSCTIETLLAYPTMAMNQAPGASNIFSLPLVRMILRVSVDGECFMAEDNGGLSFRLTPNSQECVQAILDLAEVPILVDIRGKQNLSTYLDLTPILNELEIVFTPRDRQGRWRMRSRADFFNPGYPFPVVGFGTIPGVGPSGTRLVMGDDGGQAPFGGMVFEGSSGRDAGPCVPIRPRVASQGFWKRQCKGPQADLRGYLPIVRRTETFSQIGNVRGLCAELSPSPSSDKCEQAEGQFMALLLNLASGRLAPCNCVEDPDLGSVTVAQAVALLDQLLADPGRDRRSCTRAKDIADRLNRGETLVSCASPD